MKQFRVLSRPIYYRAVSAGKSFGGVQTLVYSLNNLKVLTENIYVTNVDFLSQNVVAKKVNRAMEDSSIAANLTGSSTIIQEMSQFLGPISILFIMFGGLLLAIPGMPKQFAKRVITIGILLVFVANLLPHFLPQLIHSYSGLPWWVMIFIGGLICISILQAFVALFLGWRAANSFAGNLAASLFKATFKILIAPFKAIKSIISNAD